MFLSRKEHRQFYEGFSNEIIWPIFHDLQTMCNFNPEYWKSYLAVNRKFGDSVSSLLNPDDFVWVHDYHLMCFAGELRRMGNECPCAFFLHIPFPPLDIFLKLPWRLELLRALLDFDLVGFQTERDRRNFLECL